MKQSPPPQPPQTRIRRDHPAILRFFKERKAREVGVGEGEVGVLEIGQFFAFTVKEAARRWAAHGVAVGEDIEAGAQAADVGMNLA